MAAIKAVAKVESGGTIAFDTHYRARILFEAHQFRKYTTRQFDAPNSPRDRLLHWDEVHRYALRIWRAHRFDLNMIIV